MQRKTYSLSMLLGLVIALCACTSAFAASPAQDVYNPDGDVLDFVATGTPTGATEDNTSTCDENSASSGSGTSGSADCGTTTTVPETTPCTSGSGVSGSGSDCAEIESADVCGSSTSGSGSNGCGTTTPVVTKGQLPFTGFQAGLVGLMGLALLGGGITMRRFTRRRD